MPTIHYATRAAQPRAPQDIDGTPLMVRGRPSGFIKGDELYRRNDGSKHFLRRYPGPGIAFDQDGLKQAAELGVTRIRIRDTETNIQYSTPLAAIYEHGKPFDFGHGEQICLRFEQWLKIAPDGTVTQPKAQQQPAAVQGQLFAIEEPRRVYP